MVFNCTQLDDLLETYYLSPLYALEFCIGFPGNLLVVTGYVFCLKEWQSINIYLFNLAVSDLLFLCTLPRLSWIYAHGEKECSPYLSIINRYLLHVDLYSSILFMVWVSVDRFLLIRHPQRNHFLLRPKVAMAVAGLSWLAINVQVAPLIVLMFQDTQKANWSRCKDFSSLSSDDTNTFGYSMGLTLTGYVLPFLGLCFSSYHIARLLKLQEAALQRKNTSMYRRPLRVVTAAAVMFLVLYSPYHVMRNVRIASQDWLGMELCTKMYIKGLYILTRPIAFLHSVINPVFYFLMGDLFRELLCARFRELWSKIR